MRWPLRTSSAPALALAFLAAGCASNAAPARPAHGVNAAPTSSAAAQATPAPAALPFRLPCPEDDPDACTRGCDEKQVEDCVTLGTMYMTGVRVAGDKPRALDLYRGACNEGSARGCMRLADAYHDGLLQDQVEEASLYRRACDAGANLGCVAAGRAYLSGRGVGQDPVFAANLFGRVCLRGNAHACFELARLYEHGEGVPADKTRAFELFTKACKLGHDEGCLYASRTEEVLPPRN